jgi:hypothetical protein
MLKERISRATSGIANWSGPRGVTPWLIGSGTFSTGARSGDRPNEVRGGPTRIIILEKVTHIKGSQNPKGGRFWHIGIVESVAFVLGCGEPAKID